MKEGELLFHSVCFGSPSSLGWEAVSTKTLSGTNLSKTLCGSQVVLCDMACVLWDLFFFSSCPLFLNLGIYVLAKIPGFECWETISPFLRKALFLCNTMSVSYRHATGLILKASYSVIPY